MGTDHSNQENASQAVTSLVPNSAHDAGANVLEDVAGKKPQQQKRGLSKKSGQSRRKSRELVLKALYRGMLNQMDLAPVFKDMRDDPDYKKAEEVYFTELLTNVTSHLTALDEKLLTFIDRPIAELSPIEHSILRISGYELIYDMTIPYRVVINEGVELAKLFGATDGHKYINGVLDKLAAEVRTHEFNQMK
jgi:N utilization substance protein B